MEVAPKGTSLGFLYVSSQRVVQLFVFLHTVVRHPEDVNFDGSELRVVSK